MITLKYSHKILSRTIPCSWNYKVWIVSATTTPHCRFWDQIRFKFEYYIVIIAVDAIKSNHNFAPIRMSTVQFEISHDSLFASTHQFAHCGFKVPDKVPFFLVYVICFEPEMLLFLKVIWSLDLRGKIWIQVIRDSLGLTYQVPIVAIFWVFHKDLHHGVRFTHDVKIFKFATRYWNGYLLLERAV